MNNVGVTGTKTIRTSGWVLVFAVGLLQTVSAVFLLAFSGPSTFEADTGVSWAALSEQFPTVADQFSMVQQASLVGTLALGLISLAVTFFALRNGQRWGWFTMWILPASMIPGMVSLAQSENQSGVALFAGALILVASVGIVLSYRRMDP
jgi:hypothetical protein